MNIDLKCDSGHPTLGLNAPNRGVGLNCTDKGCIGIRLLCAYLSDTC